MKKTAKILYVLCLVAIPAMIVMYLLDAFALHGQIAQQGWKGILIYIGIGIALFIILGGISHVLIARARENKNDCKGVYYFTFIPYVLLWIVLLLLLVVLKFIDIMIGLFTGGEKGLDNVLNFLFESLGLKKKAKASESVAFTVVENGSERVLILMESKQDADPDSPFYTKQYNRFRDDTGKYWRSYDNNETFVRETEKQTAQGY